MTVYLTEKSSQVKALAKVMNLKLNGNTAVGKYNGEDVTIVPLAGHILRLYKPDEYNEIFKKKSWKNLVAEGYIPFIPNPFKKRVSEKSKERGTDYQKIYKRVKEFLNKADKIILAPDPDNEGVTLAMEVVEMTGNKDKVVGLIRMNKLEPTSLKKELSRIDKEHYKKMYLAGNLRAEYDWSFGMNLTIAATALLAKNTVLHIGGVKLPTIRLVVERDKEFENFKKKFYYNVKVTVEKDGKKFDILFKTQFEKKEDAEKLAKEINNSKTLTVLEHKEQNKKKEPPLPFTLTKLQATLNRMYNMNSDKVLKIVQALYDRGLESYPRTGCEYYSTGLYNEVPDIINKNLVKYKEYNSFIKKYLSSGTYRKGKAFNDKEVDKHSHTALAPTEKYGSMSPDEFKVFDTVTRRFLAQISPQMEYLSITGKVKFKDKIGNYSESIITFPGWYEIETQKENMDEIKKERNIPQLKKGDILNIIATKVVEVETKPKPRFTEASLLEAMEKIARFYDDPLIKEMLKDGGIGTEATRTKILQDLFKGGYFIKQGKKIVSTDKARKLIKILPEKMSSPVRRAEMEKYLKEILEDMPSQKFRDMYKKFVEESYSELLKIAEKNQDLISGAPTKKMIDYAKYLAKKYKIKLSKNDLMDRKKIEEIIQKYGNSNGEYKISEKQMNILKQNIDSLSDEIKELMKKDTLNKEEYTKINETISNIFKQNSKNKQYKLSEKQINILLKNKDKLTKKVQKLLDKEEFTFAEYQELKKALDKLFKSFNKKKK